MLHLIEFILNMLILDYANKIYGFDIFHWYKDHSKIKD